MHCPVRCLCLIADAALDACLVIMFLCCSRQWPQPGLHAAGSSSRHIACLCCYCCFAAAVLQLRWMTRALPDLGGSVMASNTIGTTMRRLLVSVKYITHLLRPPDDAQAPTVARLPVMEVCMPAFCQPGDGRAAMSPPHFHWLCPHVHSVIRLRA
jgi:hypothetical protein